MAGEAVGGVAARGRRGEVPADIDGLARGGEVPALQQVGASQYDDQQQVGEEADERRLPLASARKTSWARISSTRPAAGS